MMLYDLRRYLNERRQRGHRLVDIWAGRTHVIHGHRFFEMPDGRLRPDVGNPPRFSDLVGWPEALAEIKRRGWALQPQIAGGGNQGWEELIDVIVANGTQVSNTTTETIVCPDFSIPANYMAASRTLRLWAFGVMSNVVTTPGTLTLRVRWGGVSGVVLVASAAQGLDTTARTNSLWAAYVIVTCQTSGASGTFMSGGIMFGNVLSSTAANLLPALLGSAGAPLASGNVAVTVDTTAVKLLSVTAQFSVATSPTNLTCQQRIIEALN